VTAFKIRTFGGIMPRLNPRYLPEDKAQTALNLDASRQGALTPLRGVGSVVKNFGQTVSTIFRYNEDRLIEDANFWIAATTDTDFCRSQIIEDTNEIVYFTDNDNANVPPSFFYNGVVDSDATSFNQISGYFGFTQKYKLGVNAPLIAPSVAITDGTTPEDVDGLTRETRVYVFTYVYTKAGREMESPPSPASDTITTYLGTTETITLNTLSTAVPEAHMAAGEVKKRIYRAVAGAYFFAGEIPVTQQTFLDNVSPDDLGEELPSLTWSPPPADMKGMTNFANGMMAGFVGKTVYISEPYIPHAWPINYAISVDSPVVGLASLDTTLVILTNERPYYLQGSEPQFLTLVEGDANQGCASKRSIATLNGEVYFISPDGLCATSPRGTRLLTEGMFTYRQWDDQIRPSSTYRAFTHDQKYTAFGYQGFIYDAVTRSFTTHDIGLAGGGYVDERLDKFYVTLGPAIYEWGAGANTTVSYRSKIFSFPSEVSFSCMQVEAEDYGYVYVRIYTTDQAGVTTVLHEQNVTSRNMFRLPSVLSRDWQIEIFTTSEIFNVAVAQAGDELANV